MFSGHCVFDFQPEGWWFEPGLFWSVLPLSTQVYKWVWAT